MLSLHSLRPWVARRPRRIAAMRFLDWLIPTKPGLITLVAKRAYGLSGNLRVVADALAERRGRDITLYFEGELPSLTRRCLEEKGIRILGDFNAESAHVLASSQMIVVDHSIRDCYISQRKSGRKIANIWHGVPIKSIELAMPVIKASHRQLIENNAKLYDYMIASSGIDRLAVSASFGVSPQRVYPAGLPRYDLFRDDYPLPADLKEQQAEIIRQKAGRRLVLYAPTFRECEVSPITSLQPYLPEVTKRLAALGAVLGIRPHQYDTVAQELSRDGDFLVFGKDECPETNLLLKHVDVLVTDFSSLWVDFLWLQRPILGFAPSLDHYQTRERGFLYPFSTIFPGPFFEQPEQLLTEIEKIHGEGRFRVEHELQRSLFLSGGSGWVTPTVVDQLCELMDS